VGQIGQLKQLPLTIKKGS
jgi:hypothetical protein